MMPVGKGSGLSVIPAVSDGAGSSAGAKAEDRPNVAVSANRVSSVVVV
jgi:hypothetical protein